MLRGQIRYRSPDRKFDADLLIERQDETMPGIMAQVVLPKGTAGSPNGLSSPRYSYAWNISGNPAMGVKATDTILTMNYDFGWATWSSTTGLRFRDGFSYNDNSLPVPGTDQNVDQYVVDQTNNYYEETHFAGQWGNLNWLAGGDYLYVPTRETANVTRTPTPTNPSTGSTQLNHQRWTSAAIFGLLDYSFTSQLDLDMEGRYTWDDKTLTSHTDSDLTGQPVASPAPYSGKTSPQNFSYDVTLSYKPDDGYLVYAKVGRGYRVGGFNATLGDPRQPIPIPPTYGDETTQDYEIGTKDTLTSWLYGTLAAYYNKVNGVLTQDNNGCALNNPVCPVQQTNFVVNAGTAFEYGIESELDGHHDLLGGMLNLNLNSSYMEGQFSSGNYDGLTVPQMPKWEFGGTARYDHPITDKVSAFGSVNFSGQWKGRQDVSAYSGTVNGVPYKNFYEPLANEGVFDLRAGVDYGNLEFAVYANNAFDDQYVYVRTPTTFRWGGRDSWGVELHYKW